MIVTLCFLFCFLFTVVWTEPRCGKPPKSPGTTFYIGENENPAWYESLTFKQDDKIRYRCSEGYHTTSYSGSMTECKGGTWTPMTLQCTELTCGALNPPSNGRRLDDNYNIGSYAMFACNPGYNLQGPSRLLCRVDGEWNPREPPRCIPVKCPDVSEISNGRSFQENWQRPENEYQNVIRYTCNEGYSIEGSNHREARRVCQADGTWNGSMPQCTTPRCPEIPLGNGTVTYFGDREIYTLAFFTCNENFDLSSVANTECGQNLKWVEIPKCIPRLQPWAPDNGFTSTDALIKNGESYNAICYEGFLFANNKNDTFLVGGVGLLGVRNELGNLILISHPNIAYTSLKCKDARVNPWAPDNGFASTDALIKHGGSYNAICDEGFLFANNKDDTFLVGGVGSLVVRNVLGNLKLNSHPNIAYTSLKCKDARVKPWAPDNGFTSTDAFIKNGESYNATCDEGFLFANNEDDTFLVGGVGSLWIRNVLGNLKLISHPNIEYTSLKCKDARLPPWLPENGNVTVHIVRHGDTYTVSCISGFKLFNRQDGKFETLSVRRVKNQFGKLIFEKSHKLALNKIKCRDVRSEPWSPRNGYHNHQSVLYDNMSYEAKCTDGFIFFNTKTKTFLGNEVSLQVKNKLGELKLPDYPSLSTDDLECKDARCDTPSVENGSLSTDGILRYPVNNEIKLQNGQKIIMKCNDGYELFDRSKNKLLTSKRFTISCSFSKIVPDTLPVCRIPIEHASTDNATRSSNASTLSPNEQITVIVMTTVEAEPKDYSDNYNSVEHEQALEPDHKTFSNTTAKPENEPMVSSTHGPSTATYNTSSPSDDGNRTDDSEVAGSCTLKKNSTHISYWNTSHDTELYEFQTVIIGERVRVSLTCPHNNDEYFNSYYDAEADESTKQEAEIECVNGTFTDHNLKCETESKEESNSTPTKCTHIDNGYITDRGKSVKCQEDYKLWFENDMDASLYTANSCKCNQETGRLQCMGTNVQCKPIGCTIPTHLEQGLSIYDPLQRTPTSGANRYEIKHNEFLTFTCSPFGDTYYEPNKRMFVCDKGLWIAKQRDSETVWDLGNNGSFPKCRPVNCSFGFCKFEGRCIRDNQCECPKHITKGDQCEIPLCSQKCENGRTCIAPNTCTCKEGFYGSRCEIAGCGKPEGNLVNIEKQVYGDGETIMITQNNCNSGFLLSSGETTISCKDGQWSMEIRCVQATDYKIRVATAISSSDISGAGTDGHVYIRLKGTDGDTGYIRFDGRFERNRFDDNNRSLPDVGTIITIDVRVNRRNRYLDGWIPSHVTVHDQRRNQFYLFRHDKTELDNKSITLVRTGCVTEYTEKLGYRDAQRGDYHTGIHKINDVFACMMICSEYNCFQAWYMASSKYCGIDTRIARPVIGGSYARVLNPHCVIT